MLSQARLRGAPVSSEITRDRFADSSDIIRGLSLLVLYSSARGFSRVTSIIKNQHLVRSPLILYHLLDRIPNYYATSSVSGQDEPNPAM